MLTMICTLEPATGNYMMVAACELYQTMEQTVKHVMNREYINGVPTYLRTYRGTTLPDFVQPYYDLF